MSGRIRLGLFGASSVEAFLLLVLLGYGPLYVSQTFHSTAVVASLASGAPTLATFIGSTFWGSRLHHLGFARVVRMGMGAYLATGLVIFFAPSAPAYIAGVFVTTLFSSALAPATLTFLTVQGGQMGKRLARRLQWQSAGWMLGGAMGGWVITWFRHAYPDLILILALIMFGLLPLTIGAWPTVARSSGGRGNGHLKYLILLVLPFFLAYAGNEGFFTNFALYLHAVHVSAAWVGWSSAISTGLGWALASSLGRWSDRVGGKSLLMRVLLGYALMYLLMSLSHSQVVVIVAFSLPLYPILNIGMQRAMAESLPSEQHGAAMGLVNGATGLATFGGSLLMGASNTLWGADGLPWTAVMLVSLGLAGAGFLYRASPKPVHTGTSHWSE